jgi:hypothetical protein
VSRLILDCDSHDARLRKVIADFFDDDSFELHINDSAIDNAAYRVRIFEVPTQNVAVMFLHYRENGGDVVIYDSKNDEETLFSVSDFDQTEKELL